jgi:hypothetical protein
VTAILPPAVDAAVGRYLALADRFLPGRVVGLHVVGSIALGAYREARSDIDVIVVLDRRLDTGELRRLKGMIVAAGVRSGVPQFARGRFSMPGVVNGSFVVADELTKPVTTIEPVAAHAGHSIAIGRAFDVNPVVWKTFAERGITVRGDDASSLGLDPEPDRLGPWNRANLDSYWRPWAEAALDGRSRNGSGGIRLALTPRWLAAWGAMGPARLHHTIATGEVISKEDAATYARDTFGPEHHPVIDEALSYWREEPSPNPSAFASRRDLVRRRGELALAVIEDAGRQ